MSPVRTATTVRPSVSVALVAGAFCATMIGGALPTPLYPAYEHRFGFGPLTVTIVFAMYAVGVLAALLGVGRSSDTIGRRPVLLAGLAAAAASSAIFLVAGGLRSDGGLVLLYVARVFSGVSAGIFTGTATATLTDLSGEKGRNRASIVAAVANVGGLGLGPLICGVLARYADAPLRTPYAVHLALVALAAAAVLAVPEPVEVERPVRWRFERLSVPQAGRGVFIEAGTASFAGFALLGMFTSVSPVLLALLGHHDPALTGLIVFVTFAASVAGGIASTRISTPVSLLGGTAGLIAGLALVGAALSASSLALLVAGGVVGGFAQGTGFRSALQLVTGMSPPGERGGVSSSFFAVCYVGLSLPVVGIGVGTRQYGLVHTGEVFTGVLGLLCLVALASLSRRLRH
jgi:MFS family permease